MALFHVGRDRTAPGFDEVSVTLPEPSRRAVATLPSPSMKAIRLPSGDHTASVTVVGKVICLVPIVTMLVPSERSTMPDWKAMPVSPSAPVPWSALPDVFGAAQAAASSTDAATAVV